MLNATSLPPPPPPTAAAAAAAAITPRGPEPGMAATTPRTDGSRNNRNQDRNVSIATNTDTTTTTTGLGLDGLLSPFSPIVTRVGGGAGVGRPQHEENVEQQQQHYNTLTPWKTPPPSSLSFFMSPEEKNNVMSMLSLQPCRKVSICIRVLPMPPELQQQQQQQQNGKAESTTGKRSVSAAAGMQQIVFPHYKANGSGVGRNVNNSGVLETPSSLMSSPSPVFMTPKIPSSSATPQSAVGGPIRSSIPLPPPTSSSVKDMVVVNPTAFGKNIPARMTVEVAQTVAKCAHISTEDWLRLYEFHHVIWPSSPTPSPSPSTQEEGSSTAVEGEPRQHHHYNHHQQFNTLDTICRAAALDAMTTFKSSLLISLGQEPTAIGTSSVSRTSGGNGVGVDSGSSSSSSAVENVGLWSKLLTEVQALQDEKTIVTLTMVEILEENPHDVSASVKMELGFNSYGFYDVLDSKNTPNLKLRHTDMKGAIVENATEVGLDNMSALIEGMQGRQRQRQRLWKRRQQKKKQLQHRNNNNKMYSSSPLKNNGKKKSPAQTKSYDVENNDNDGYYDEDDDFDTSDIGPGTAIVATINVWKDGISYNLKRQPNAQITVVELSSPSGRSGGRTSSSSSSSFIQNRKSAISLSQALRQLLLKSLVTSSGATKMNTSMSTTATSPSLIPTNPGSVNRNKKIGPNRESPNKSMISTSSLPPSSIPAVSFRETTLTAVLQRSMEASKIVLVASISPLAKDYDDTVATLNYLRKLLVRPGKAVSSPFKSMEYEYGTSSSTPTANGIGGIMSSPSPSKRSTRNESMMRTPSSTPNAEAIAQTPASTGSTPRSRIIEAPENAELINELSHSEGMVRSIVSDPRQRLARLVEAASPGRNGGKSPSGTELNFDDALDDNDEGIDDDPDRYDLPSQIDDEGSSEYNPPVDSEVAASMNVDVESAHSHTQKSTTKTIFTASMVDMEPPPSSNKPKNVFNEYYDPSIDQSNDRIEGKEEWYTEEEIHQELSQNDDDVHVSSASSSTIQNPNSQHDEFIDPAGTSTELSTHNLDTGTSGQGMGRFAEQYLNSVEDDNDSTFDLLDESGVVNAGIVGYSGTGVPRNDVGALEDNNAKWLYDHQSNEEHEGEDTRILETNNSEALPRTYTSYSREADASSEQYDDDDEGIGPSTTDYDLPDEPSNDDGFFVENQGNSFPYEKATHGANGQVQDSFQSAREVPSAENSSVSVEEEIGIFPQESNVTHQLRQEIKELREQLEEEIEEKRQAKSTANATLSAFDDLRVENQNLLDQIRAGSLENSNASEVKQAREELVFQLQDKILSLEKSHQLLADDRDELLLQNTKLTSSLKDSQDAFEQAKMSADQWKIQIEQIRSDDTKTIEDLMNQIRSHEVVVTEVHRLREELERAKENQLQIDSDGKKSEELAAKVTRLERQLLEANSNLRQADTHANELSRHIESSELLSKEKEAELEALRERASKMDRQISTKDEIINDLRSRYQELELKHEQDVASLRTIEADLRIKGATIEDLEVLEEKLAFLERERRRMEQTAEETNSKLKETRREKESEVMNLSSRLASSQEDLKSVRQELSATSQELASSNEQSYALKRQNEDLLTEVETLQKQLRHLESDREKQQNEYKYLTAKIATQQKELNEASQRAQRLQDDNDHLKLILGKTKEDLEKARVGTAEETAGRIVEIAKLKNELVWAKEDANNAESKILSLRKQEETLTEIVNEQKEQIDHLHLLLNRARDEASESRRMTSAEKVEYDSLIYSLRQQIQDLSQQIESVENDREESRQLLESRSRSYESVMLDLQQSKDELKRHQQRVDRLSVELEDRRADSQRKDEKLHRYETELRRIREETKSRTTSAMEKAIYRTEELTREKESLEQLVDDLQRERDACFEALQEGRRRLLDLSRSQRLYLASEIEDVLPLPLPREIREKRTLTGSHGSTNRSFRSSRDHARDSGLGLTSPRTQLSQRAVDSPLLVRAEEIAACVAMDAQHAIQQKEDDNQNLKAKIYQLEVSRKAEEEELKARIRSLERELGQRW